MHAAKARYRYILIPTILLLVLGACSAPDTPAPTASPTPGITLTPFASPTLIPAVTDTPRPVSSPTPPPTPTATPFLYQIAGGDTLIGIAFRFGITLEEILAANPGIDPQFLVVGADLIIPLPDNPGTAGALPTPLAEVVPLAAPVCYPAEDSSLWCFARYENQSATAVENLAAQISVYGKDGALLATRTAIAPVNVLPPGKIVPVVAWFAGIGPDYSQATALLTAAIPISDGDPRYAAITFAYEAVLRGNAATVYGDFSGMFSQARLGIVAYDAAGQVLGVRVILLEGNPARENDLDFSTDVFSLGGEIFRVDVLAEAYP